MDAACPRCSEAVPVGARFCPRCGAALANVPVEERKLATVLFADITGSTTLGERFDPERWRALLRRFFSVMAATIEAWGGTVQKFMGDAVMATFGVPIVREDDAERALRAACEMLDRLKDLNAEFEARHGVTLAIRVGVNTGEVIADADQLLVTGDPVNVAARLEQMAEPGTILAGERTYAAAQHAFSFGPPETRDVRGKAAPVTIRRVLRPLTDALDRRVGMQVAMVGRDQEVESLSSLFHEAWDTSSPRMALVTGPAGIGKSRLIREFLNLASARHPETSILQGRCPSAGQRLTYWALGELLRRECGISLDDPASQAADRVRSRVQDILARTHATPADVDHTVFALAMTAGIGLPGNPMERLHPTRVDQELSMAWPRFISAYAAAGPVVVVIEDLHWADDRLVAMVERLLARSTGSLLLIATARPEFRQAHAEFAAGGEELATVTLRPLTSQQAGVLFDEILGGSELPESWRRDLVATADGNPFFLEEIIRRQIESGTFVRQEDQWRVIAGATRSPLPDTVQAVLAARIDALPAAPKRALQEAAVIGRVFWDEPVRRATGSADLTPSWLDLEAKGLVSVRPTSSLAGELEFIFKHALVRDVAYAGLPRARRARAHAEAARWLEQIAGDRRAELSELIANHYRNALFGDDADLAWADDPAGRADLGKRAFGAMLAAGAAARKRYAVPQALDLHQAALQLAQDEVERVRVLEAIGDDHEGAFHGDDAVPAWEAALAALPRTAEARPDRIRLIVKCATMTGMRWGGFKVVPPSRQVDQYIEAGLAEDPEPRDRGWLLALRAFVNTRKGEPREIEAVPLPERMRAGDEALRIAEELGDVDLQVLATRALSGISITQRAFERTVELTKKQIELLDRIVASRDRALALFYSALTLMDMEGRYGDGLELAERSYRLAKELAPHDLLHATFLLLYGNSSLGRWPAIDALLDEHVKAFQVDKDMTCPYVRGGPLLGAAVLAHRGELARAREMTDLVPMDWGAPALPEARHGFALLAMGDAGAAREDAERILAAGRRPSIEEAPLEIALMLDACLELQDAESLRRFLPTADSLAPAMPLIAAARDRAVGAVTLWDGDAKGAQASLTKALARYQHIGHLFEAARTREFLADALPADEARPVRQAALQTYELLGAVPHAERLRQTYGIASPV